MGIFSSETSANRHNSGKFETLIALQNDMRWFFLHSWFSKFPPSLQEEILGKFLGSHSFIQPLRYAATPLPSHQLILIQKLCYKGRHLIWQSMILWSVVLFVACEQNYLSRPLFSYITSASAWVRLLLCKGKFPAFFCWKRQILLIKQIFYWLVINCLKFYWLLICWTPHPDPPILHLLLYDDLSLPLETNKIIFENVHKLLWKQNGSLKMFCTISCVYIK